MSPPEREAEAPSERPGGGRSTHYVRRGMRGSEWRTVLAAAAGAALGVGAVVLYLGRNLVGRDRLDAQPSVPPARSGREEGG